MKESPTSPRRATVFAEPARGGTAPARRGFGVTAATTRGPGPADNPDFARPRTEGVAGVMAATTTRHDLRSGRLEKSDPSRAVGVRVIVDLHRQRRAPPGPCSRCSRFAAGGRQPGIPSGVTCADRAVAKLLATIGKESRCRCVPLRSKRHITSTGDHQARYDRLHSGRRQPIRAAAGVRQRRARCVQAEGRSEECGFAAVGEPLPQGIQRALQVAAGGAAGVRGNREASSG